MNTESTPEVAPEVDLDRIIRDLNVDWYTFLPEVAIRAAQQHREAITPRLIEVLRSATAAAKAGCVPNGAAPTIALFLLAEFEVTEALPAVIEVLSMPDEDAYELFGDVLEDDISKLLAIFAATQLDVIDDLIQSEGISQYVRWTFANTYVQLFRDGRISRQMGLDRLGRLLREAIDSQDYQIGPGLILALLKFAPEECWGDIKRAYEAGIADDEILSLEECREIIDGGEEAMQMELARLDPARISDTVSEIEWWECFQPDPDDDADDEVDEVEDDPPLKRERIDSRHTPHLAGPPVYEPVKRKPKTLVSTIRSGQPRVGRNQACPCGSGKKFKKCCGSRA